MNATRIPKARLVRPAGRPFQIRYTCPVENREVRISTGTRNEDDALRQLNDIQAKLQLGIVAKPKARKATGPYMAWEDFRERYAELQLSGLRVKSAIDAESRLDIAERILKPKRLSDIADSEALHELQSKLLAGAESRYDPPRRRSAHTVRSHMASVMAALNWAAFMEWLPAVPKIRKVKCSKLKAMKGRPISQVEFDKLLAATPGEVGEAVADSWEHVLRGLWESALRLDELLHVSWDDPTAIMPDWSGTYPVLTIPADLQKNDTEEAIPLLPGFEALLLETPEHERTGWVFHPARLRQRKDHQRRRLDGEWVGKVISRIGESAGVVVEAGKGSKPPKYASAHDLRRSCADRLIDQGVPEREVQRVLRHASGETTRRHYAPGTVQRSAGIIRKAAGVPRYNLVG